MNRKIPYNSVKNKKNPKAKYWASLFERNRHEKNKLLKNSQIVNNYHKYWLIHRIEIFPAKQGKYIINSNLRPWFLWSVWVIMAQQF